MPYIDAKDIFAATDRGLDIILAYYPTAEKCLHDKNHSFKIRDTERTASASLFLAKDDLYKVIDYGDDQKPRNAIDVVMYEENKDFKDAIIYIARRWNIQNSDGKIETPKADYQERKKKDGEVEGSSYFKRKESLSADDLKTLGPYVTRQVAAQLGFLGIDEYVIVKGGKAKIIKATADYPIFAINPDPASESPSFHKIYQPKSVDKRYRFSYSGDKPSDFVFGLTVVRQAYELHVDQVSQLDEDHPDYEKDPKLDRIFIASGDRDAINLKSIDPTYQVIWFNSESAKFSWKLFRELSGMAREVINVPDIDVTGLKKGREKALKFLEMKTLWLPQYLAAKRDWRGHARKDLTDWVEVTPERRLKIEFEALIRTAPAAKFWREYRTKEGNTKYDFHNVQAYYFLELNGFYRFQNRNRKEGYIFIRMVDNIVEEIDPGKIEDFIHDFLASRRMSFDLRNFIYNTTKLNERSVNRISYKEVNFDDYDFYTQYMFFQNKTWEIKAGDIIEHRINDVSRFVWADEVIPYNVRKLPDAFEFTWERSDSGHYYYDIKINDDRCLFMRYLIQTSRIYWRDELEERIGEIKDPAKRNEYLKQNRYAIAGPLLTATEQEEQKLHLINKLYALGYLLHRYKDPSKAWCVFAMDNIITEEGESHGGSGKSICFGALKHLMKYDELNGRNAKLVENPHVFEKVSEHTDYILIDECDRYFKFSYFFKAITGDLEINPKGTKQYIIPFREAPKFCITSNYTLYQNDPSTQRRLLYTVFSDYYHYNSADMYNEHRSPRDDFGKALFDDFSDDEWNYFFNTMALAIKLYLSAPEKIDPPMQNVMLKNLKTEMTDIFKNWADVYFVEQGISDDGDTHKTKLEQELSKQKAFEDFLDNTKVGNKSWKMTRFTKALKAWCKYYGYLYNPAHMANKDGRIIRNEEGQTVEKFYIGTRAHTLENEAPDF